MPNMLLPTVILLGLASSVASTERIPVIIIADVGVDDAGADSNDDDDDREEACWPTDSPGRLSREEAAPATAATRAEAADRGEDEEFEGC